MAIGAFEDIPRLSIPEGTARIRTAGYHPGDRAGGADYVAVDPPAGGADVGTARSANRRWWRIDEAFPDACQFGARGLGAASDDTAAIAGAVAFLHKGGGGTLFFRTREGPAEAGAYYNVTSPIPLLPGVSLQGDARRPKIKNLVAEGGAGVQQVFLPGNFHPAFTQELTYRDCGAIAAGRRATLRDPAHAAAFAVGDQVLIASSATGTTGSFSIPNYAILNEVEAVVGATLVFRRPIDVSFVGGVARLASVNGRNGVPLFFYSDASLSDLDIETPHFWISDSACRSVRFVRLTVSSRASVTYGNCFQHVDWESCVSYFSETAGEQSHNSLRTRARDSKFIFKPMRGVAPAEGLGLQERARHVLYENCEFDFGGTTLTNPIIQTGDCQDVVFRNCRGKIRSPTFDSSHLILIGTTADASFPSSGVVVEGGEYEAMTCARWAWIEGNLLAGNRENGLRNVRFRGTSAVEAIRFNNSIGGCFSIGCVYPTGALGFSGTCRGNVFTGNILRGAVAVDETTARHNLIRNNARLR
ncbi:MAG: hypothetical protein JO127_09195 [Caulobacteraceae bacterium]|nr:hypothetical protein [Caulobacteraceae bacterium]